MSNHLAIATITATLQRALQSAIQADMDGARATTLSPSEISSGTPETGVNIFLYQVITNPALHNIDATPLRTRGTPVKRQAALDLYYIFSFYGNNNELTPQRLLGSVVKTLNDRRVISQEMIQDACDRSTLTFLRQSNLAEQVQQISVMPLDLSLEDLSKTWGVFFQTPYVLSVAYKVLVVLIEGEEGFKRALPVRDRPLGNLAAPFLTRPIVEKVVAHDAPYQPICLTSTLLIQGRHLKGDRLTQIRLGDVDITPPDVSDIRIVLPLSLVPPSALQAGVQSLQVIHPAQLSSPTQAVPPSRRAVVSSSAPFVLCPTLKNIEVEALEGIEDELRSGRLLLHSDVPVRAGQRVAVSLNERSTQSPAAYLLEADPRSETTQTITLWFQDVKPGDYLVRMIVDGAESPLETDTNPESSTYQWFVSPRVLIA